MATGVYFLYVSAGDKYKPSGSKIYFRQWLCSCLLFVYFCLFDLILYVLSTIFQLYRDGSSWVEPVLSWDKCVLLKDHNAVTPVRLEPAALRSRVKHSTIEPLRSHSLFIVAPNCLWGFFCVRSLLCYAVLCVHFSFVIISLGTRALFALLFCLLYVT